MAERFSQSVVGEASRFNIYLVRYEVDIDWNTPKPFDVIRRRLRLEMVEKGDHHV
jgi:hypothetical protein